MTDQHTCKTCDLPITFCAVNDAYVDADDRLFCEITGAAYRHEPQTPAADRRAAARTYAGYRSVRISPQTGRTVVVLNSDEAGLDGRWTTLCDEHAWTCSHDSLVLATHHAADPLGWCEPCREIADRDHGAGCDGPYNCVCSAVSA